MLEKSLQPKLSYDGKGETEMWEGRGVIRLKRQLGAQMGQRPTSLMPKRESESRGVAPKPPGHAGRLGLRGRRGGGPSGSAALSWG